VDPLPLDPGDFSGNYKLVGGRLCLDFVNTLAWPDSDHPHDWFDRPENVVDWALAVDLVDQSTARDLLSQTRSDPQRTGRSLARIRRQREVIRQVLWPLACGRRVSVADVQALNELLVLSEGYRSVDPIRLEWTWEVPRRLDEIVRPVVADAGDLLVDADHARIGHCPSCHWLFYDSTRSRTRRWCDMADCGSRDKSRRYYRRKRAEVSGDSQSPG